MKLLEGACWVRQRTLAPDTRQGRGGLPLGLTARPHPLSLAALTIGLLGGEQ
jgi:hypothetical protein